MSETSQRLDQQPIDRIVCIAERRQVDLAIPAEKQLEKGGESIAERTGQRTRPLGGAPDQAPRVSRAPTAAAYQTSAGGRSRYTAITATAAGVTPGTRPAWPSVEGGPASGDPRPRGRGPGTPLNRKCGGIGGRLAVAADRLRLSAGGCTLVLDVGFHAGEVESAADRVDFERDLTPSDEIRERHTRLLERTGSRNDLTADPHGRPADNLGIPFESRPASLEHLPPRRRQPDPRPDLWE